MSEATELLADWKKVYGEMHPRRDPESMRYDDSTLALGVLLQAEIRKAAQTAPVSAGRLQARMMDRFAKHNSKDPE